MYKLALIDEKRQIEFIKDLLKIEADAIIECSTTLYKFHDDSEKFRILKNSYKKLINAINSEDHNHEYNYLILDFMSSFRVFTDHWETQIKRNFGKESDEINIFKKVTGKEFDNNFSYRFTCGLRNYIQHVDMPNYQIASSQNGNSIWEVKILLDRKGLLDNYDGWKSIVVSDLKASGEPIDFIKIINEVYESIKKINDVAINFADTKQLVKAGEELIKLKVLQGNLNGNLVMIRSEFLPDSDLEIRELPIGIAEYILNHIEIIKNNCP